MKRNSTIYLFITIICSLFLFTPSAKSENISMERIDYIEEFDEQISVDEELFEKDIYSTEDYDDYNIFTYEENDEEEQKNEIVLAPTQITNIGKRTTLKTGIERNYTVNRIQAFNTIWDDSENFKTTLRTNPSLMDTVPSLIQESHFRFHIDENTTTDWGHIALSSHNNLTLGFIDNLESSYDNGIKITTKSNRLNFSGAIYESQETHNPSGGLVLSTNELSTKAGSFIFGSGIYATDYINHHSKNTVGLFTKYNYNRFSLGLQIAQNKYFDKGDKYGTSCYIYPEYKINKSLTLSGGFTGNLGENYLKEEIGLTYKPFFNNPNDFSVSLKAIVYNGQGITNKQKIKIKTEFKL